jgi:hypothetical protein
LRQKPKASLKAVRAGVLVLALAWVLHTAASAQNIKLATPTPTPAQQKPKAPPQGSGGNVVNIPYIPPPPGPSKLPPAGGVLCMIIPGCKAPAPVIAGLFPGSFLTPGGYILIYGKNFNSAQGPGGKLQFALDGPVHDLVELAWSDTSVGGRVPDGWNWNHVARVDVWLVRQDGTRSNSIQVDFTPTYEIQQLPADAIHADCGGADKNYCSPSGNSPSIDTNHATVYGHDAGTDHYTSAQLRNGWTLYEYSFQRGDLRHATVDEPTGFNNGYNYLDLSVHWDQDGGPIYASYSGISSYRINVFIRGPKGYDWK